MEFLEEVDNDWFQWLVEDWIEQNLPYKEGYWLDSWNSFALSIRVVVWMQQIALRKNSLDTDFIKKAKISVYKQLLFLEKNIEKDIRGNHIIKNIKALLWGAVFFRKDSNVNRWVKLGINLLQRELHKQILPDGVHYERSPSYHIQVFADLMECYCALNEEDIRTNLEIKLNKMAQVVADLKHPDGLVAQFNDGGLNMTYSPKEVLAVYSDLFKEKISRQDYFQYPQAGYYGIKNENSYIVFDAGKIGPDELPGHGHPVALLERVPVLLALARDLDLLGLRDLLDHRPHGVGRSDDHEPDGPVRAVLDRPGEHQPGLGEGVE